MMDDNLKRELQKVYDVVCAVDNHLSSKDEMNAALHMASEVRHTPLTSAVKGAKASLLDLIHDLTE